MASSLERLKRRVARLQRAAEAPTPQPPPADDLPLLDWAQQHFPALLTCPPSSFHRALCDTLDGLRSRRGRKVCELAPRGSAKSSWASFFYPLRESLAGRERFTLLLSDTGAQARDYLRQITTAVQDRPDLRALYRVEPSRPWKEHHIRLSNGCEILALGTGGKVRGRKSTENRRPTLCVIDDPQNKDHIASALQRKRAWDWLTKDVLSAGEPGTNYVALGTALHRDAIVCQLQRTPGWETRTWQSIIVWPRRLDLWSEWQALLQDYDRPEEEREANALSYYRAHEREMNE